MCLQETESWRLKLLKNECKKQKIFFLECKKKVRINNKKVFGMFQSDYFYNIDKMNIDIKNEILFNLYESGFHSCFGKTDVDLNHVLTSVIIPEVKVVKVFIPVESIVAIGSDGLSSKKFTFQKPSKGKIIDSSIILEIIESKSSEMKIIEEKRKRIAAERKIQKEKKFFDLKVKDLFNKYLKSGKHTHYLKICEFLEGKTIPFKNKFFDSISKFMNLILTDEKLYIKFADILILFPLEYKWRFIISLDILNRCSDEYKFATKFHMFCIKHHSLYKTDFYNVLASNKDEEKKYRR